MKTGKTIWFTGLPSSGKTTLACAMKDKVGGYVLDGDVLRSGLCGGLGFSYDERMENVRRAAWTAWHLNTAGVNVFAAFITPAKEMQEMVRKIVGGGKPYGTLRMVYVHASHEECMARDPKGMWAAAMDGRVTNFTGVDGPYDVPVEYDLLLDTEHRSVKSCVDSVYTSWLRPKGEPTATLPGRWQCSPPHKGHVQLALLALEKFKKIEIQIREEDGYSANPYTSHQREEMWRKALGAVGRTDRVSFVHVANNTRIVHGRDVGWQVEYLKLPEHVEKISGTEERNK